MHIVLGTALITLAVVGILWAVMDAAAKKAVSDYKEAVRREKELLNKENKD